MEENGYLATKTISFEIPLESTEATQGSLPNDAIQCVNDSEAVANCLLQYGVTSVSFGVLAFARRTQVFRHVATGVAT